MKPRDRTAWRNYVVKRSLVILRLRAVAQERFHHEGPPDFTAYALGGGLEFPNVFIPERK
jgi:hypothetical protein